MRGRGLKHEKQYIQHATPAVAPHAGAWIETLGYPLPLLTDRVAPHAGAWIETLAMSYPLLFKQVAPHAGAWIETMRHSHSWVPI